jgi:hypothetical protein
MNVVLFAVALGLAALDATCLTLLRAGDALAARPAYRGIEEAWLAGSNPDKAAGWSSNAAAVSGARAGTHPGTGY